MCRGSRVRDRGRVGLLLGGPGGVTREITTLYRFFNPQGVLLYVGISKKPFERWKQHRGDKPWWLEIATVTLEHFDTRREAMSAEEAAIKGEGPLFNIVHNKKVRDLQQQTVVEPEQSWADPWAELVMMEPRLRELEIRVKSIPPTYRRCPEITFEREVLPELNRIVGWERSFLTPADWKDIRAAAGLTPTPDGLEVLNIRKAEELWLAEREFEYQHYADAMSSDPELTLRSSSVYNFCLWQLKVWLPRCSPECECRGMR